jgi:hypothetical protein
LVQIVIRVHKLMRATPKVGDAVELHEGHMFARPLFRLPYESVPKVVEQVSSSAKVF